MTALTVFANAVMLRGFLGGDAEIHSAEPITEDAYAVLLLGTASGTWDVATNEWTPRIDWHQIICPGAYFCGFARGLKRGEYLEVEGELRAFEQEQAVVVAGERFPVSRSFYAVHAIHIRRLERPPAVVNTGADG